MAELTAEAIASETAAYQSRQSEMADYVDENPDINNCVLDGTGLRLRQQALAHTKE